MGSSGRSSGGTGGVGTWSPADQGLISWAYEPEGAIVNTTNVAGTLYLSQLKVSSAASVTNVCAWINVAGATLTANQCFAGLWRNDGTLVAITADQSTNWTLTGLRVMALAGGPFALAAGIYYFGFWANGTTQPTWARVQGGTGVSNLNTNAPNLRFATANTGLTTAGTAPNPFGAQSTNANVPWAALS